MICSYLVVLNNKSIKYFRGTITHLSHFKNLFMKSFYLLVLAIAISAVSCRTKEGEPGPAGESSLTQQGSISGTVTYLDVNSNSVAVPFNYQYFETLEHNKFYYEEQSPSLYYELNFQRRDLKDANNYLRFEVNGNGMNGIVDNPDYSYVNFSFLKVINNELYEFYLNDDVIITNLNLDSTTGRLTFNFSGTVYYDGGDAAMAGSVDVILNRSRAYNGGDLALN